MSPRDSKRPGGRRLGQAGATVQRGPRDDGRWYWMIRGPKPKGEQRPVLWTGWATVAEVDRELAVLVATGRDQPAAPARQAQSVTCKTLGDLLEFWAGAQLQRSDLRAQTVANYVDLAKAVKRSIGEVLLVRVDTGTLARHRDLRLHAGRAPTTVRSELVVASMALRWGHSIGLTDRAAPEPPPLKVRTVREKVTPTQAEAWRVVLNGTRLLGQWDGSRERAPAFEGRWLDYAVLVAGTGARPKTIARLQRSDIHLRGDEVTLSLIGKVRPRYDFPARGLTAEVARRLAEADDEQLWPVRDPVGLVKAFSKRLLQVDWEALGIRQFRPYGFRRSAADALYEAHRDPSVAAALLDHSPEEAMRHYRRPKVVTMGQAVAAAGLGGPSVVSLDDVRGFRAAAKGREPSD